MYYTLLSRDNARCDWRIEFGDPKRKVVDAERTDKIDSGESTKSDTMIVKTATDSQDEIDVAVAELNKITHLMNRAASALDRTWSTIGADILCAVGGSYEAAERVTMKRAEVIDCVTSCGYMGGYPEMYGDDKEAIEWLDEYADEKTQKEVLKRAFPFSNYGM